MPHRTERRSTRGRRGAQIGLALGFVLTTVIASALPAISTTSGASTPRESRSAASVRSGPLHQPPALPPAHIRPIAAIGPNGVNPDALSSAEPDRVGALAIDPPGLSTGTVAIPGDVRNFACDSATLTLVPGSYEVWVHASSESQPLGRCAVTGGMPTSVSFATGSGPAVSTPSPSANEADVGQPVTFESTLLSPGSGGDTYAWETNPTGLGCSSSTTLTLSCTPVASGTYSVNVTVTDSLGSSNTSGTLRFTVDSDPTIGTLSDTPRTIDFGQTMLFALSGPSTGGASPYRYFWTYMPPGCFSHDSLTVRCTPIGRGAGSAEVTVYDANNGTNATTVPWVVYLDPSLAGVGVSPKGVDVGQNVTISPLGLAEGSGGYAFRWSGLPVGCAGGNRSTIECTLTMAGPVRVTLNVTDSDGRSVNSTVAFAVDPDPTVGTPNAKPGSVSVGHSVTFSVNVSGGSGSYSYRWTGLPPGCASEDVANLTCNPSGAATTRVAVTVTDSNGFNVTSAALPFTVSSSGSGVLSLPVFEGWAVVAEAAIVAVIALVVFLTRRARRRRSR